MKKVLIDTKKQKKKPNKYVQPDVAMSVDTTNIQLGQGPSSQSIKHDVWWRGTWNGSSD